MRRLTRPSFLNTERKIVDRNVMENLQGFSIRSDYE